MTKLFVTEGGINWTYYDRNILQTASLNSRQMLASTVVERGDESWLIVYYARVLTPDQHSIRIRGDSAAFIGSFQQCQQLSSDIDTLLSTKECHRPKRILLFFNLLMRERDLSDTGVYIYYKIASPLLRICGVKVDNIVTQHSEHAADVLSSYDLSTIDAIVVIGEDESVGQVVRGLLARVSDDSGVMMNDADAEVTKPSIPIGIIPADSGSAAADLVNGTTDAETCVINIILVYEPIMWWKWRQFKVVIEYLPVKEEDREFKIARNVRTHGDVDYSTTTDGPTPGWKIFRGRISGVSVIPWKLNNYNYRILKPEYVAPRLSSGKFLLSIEKSPSLSHFLKAYENIRNLGREYVAPETIENIEVTECRIRGVEPWNDPGLGTIMSNDWRNVHLPDGADIHVKLSTNCLDFLCVDDSIVSDIRMFHF